MNATEYSDSFMTSTVLQWATAFCLALFVSIWRGNVKGMRVNATKNWDVLNVTIGGKFQVTILPSPFRSRDRKPYC